MSEQPYEDKTKSDLELEDVVEVANRRARMENERLAKASFDERARFLFRTTGLTVMLMTLVAFFGVIFAVILGEKTVTVTSSSLNKAVLQTNSAQRTLDILVELSKAKNSASPEIVKLISLAREDVAAASQSLDELANSTPWWSSKMDLSIVSIAHAQVQSVTSEEAVKFKLIPTGLVRTYLMMFVICVITLCFIGCLIMYFWTNDPDKMKFAGNTIQTVLGFYIGVATGLIGLPVS